MPTEKLTFDGAFGDELVGRLERPAGEPVGWALFAHCFTCSKDLRSVRTISRTLCDRGFAVVRFDFTGLGESEGDFAESNFSSNVDDLVAAADFLAAEHEAPDLLVGHSLGGAASLVAAGRIESAAAVATIGAPSETEHLRETLLEEAPELEETDEAEVSLAGRSFRIKRQLLDDLSEQEVATAAAGLDRPLLVLHSPDDGIVGIDHADRLFEAAEHPKGFVSLDGADHLLTDERDARFAGEVLAAWAGRHAAREEAPPRGVGEPVERGEVVVKGDRTRYTTRIGTRAHALVADEPEDVGGEDRGPTPYELLLASLGACKAITVRMYADRKEWPLDETVVRLQHSRIHAEDCEECETKEGKVDRIATVLEFRGPLSGAQRERLLEIADKCPVHRTLTSETSLRARLRGGAGG
ncbi:MAG: alpha/beta fold hydrolase [Gemmatimonadota bacterium]|nr:alpha/beta fold hydrolase [Gemmatimonadota bacterium]